MNTPRIVDTPDPPRPQRRAYRRPVNIRLKLLAAAALSLAAAACDLPEPDRAEREAWEANQAAANAARAAAPVEPAVPPEPLPDDPPGTRWETAASGEGAGLILASRSGERRLVLFCRPRSGMVLVNAPRFHRLDTGEPLTLASGGVTVALASEVLPDSRRGGVSATAPLASELSDLLRSRDPITLAYGGWSSGPHGPIMPEIAQAFIAACRT
jgi:hypothetical protein